MTTSAVASFERRRDGAAGSAPVANVDATSERRTAPPDRYRPDPYDLVCLSHLRWDFVHQRPQHLLSRCARDRRVFFVEEPVFGAAEPRIEVSPRQDNLVVAVPHLPDGLAEDAATAAQRDLLDGLLRDHAVGRHALWYYTPMALPFSRHLAPAVTVYDCMDELSAFAHAPRELRDREAELLRRADLVFTGGHTLYEAKRDRHPRVFAFPSSVDVPHFRRARAGLRNPADQAGLPGPRLGFFGVIDERMDLNLLAGLAERRPDWQIVMLGPVVKIAEADLPRPANIHYLGRKGYDELPAYLAHWDVALLPFAQNESTRFISPTKTPEYLAAGRPVVSTPIRDVVRPYGALGLVRIADGVDAFEAAVAGALAEHAAESPTRTAWLGTVDDALSQMSWDRTWADMERLMADVLAAQKGHMHAGV